MSENLSILDGELRRQFAPVDRLSVNNQGGGVSPWVISDFLDVSTLSVSENGLYLAAEEEYDCYEEVEVDISEELGEGDYRRITGKDPNLDPNNDYVAGLDENGNLTKEMIPAAIHIVVPPRKRKYLKDETLDFSGIHVYLMDGNNHRYTDSNYPTGEIPFSELIFPVTIAEGGSGDPSEHIGNTITFSRDGYSIAFSDTYDDINGKFYCYALPGITSIYAEFICYSRYGIPNPTSVTYHGSSVTPDNNRETVNGWGTINIGLGANDGLSWITTTEYFRDNAGIIKNVLGIDLEEIDYNAGEVPVQWIRSDGAILEDTFNIEIVSEEEPVPEPEPDPWGGYADVSWGGHHYNLNRRIVPEVHYANGYLWQEGISYEYNVEQAASMGWLILIR